MPSGKHWLAIAYIHTHAPQFSGQRTNW